MTTALETIPSLKGEFGLGQYLQQIRQIPILDEKEEYMLAKRFLEHDCLESAHKLVTSHLRLVAKIAMGYKGYGLPLNDLIAEGNIGLMQAVKRYDPERGFRLSTYAMWWIKAAIQEFILHSWSLVKMGTTAAQKKLFFNLNKIKNKLRLVEEGDLHPDDVKTISVELNVPEQDVVEMNRRMATSDHSLNAPLRIEGESEWQDFVADETDDQETAILNNQAEAHRGKMLHTALQKLKPREQEIIQARRLREEPKTLEELSQLYGISRERIRQIENRAFEKLQTHVLALASNV